MWTHSPPKFIFVFVLSSWIVVKLSQEKSSLSEFLHSDTSPKRVCGCRVAWSMVEDSKHICHNHLFPTFLQRKATTFHQISFANISIRHTWYNVYRARIVRPKRCWPNRISAGHWRCWAMNIRPHDRRAIQAVEFIKPILTNAICVGC